ncbi:MAG: tetratricopeptide repeat protein [bacterium]|nr:tetratricopeptide repeat protein [bacterium]
MEQDTIINNSTPVKESVAEKVAQWSLLTIIALTPLLFIPSQVVLFQFTKVLLLFIGIIVTFCACIVARLKDGSIGYTKSYLFLALAIVPVAYGFSSLFSASRKVSIVGSGFEVGSLAFIIGVSIFAFFVAFFFATKKRTLYAYLAFLVPIPLVALFQLLRLFVGPDFLSFGVLASPTATLLGGWNDLGIYFGAAALFSFITLELLQLDRWIKTSFIALLVVSLFFLTIINFTAIWYILAAFALIFFVYNFSFNKSVFHDQSPIQSVDAQRTVPIVSFAVIIVSIIFILFKGNLYTSLSSLGMTFFDRLAVENIEVRPSWVATWDVAQDAFVRNPVFGAGPNRFLNEWLLSKPDVINSTIFWGTDFNYGIGLIPTFLVTTGIIGTLAWLVFFALFLYTGFKALFTKNADSFLGYVTISSFIIALYLWIFAFIYVPSSSLLILTFFFTGIFMASLIQNGLVKMEKFNFIRDPRTSFVSVLVFIVLLLAVLIATYGIGRKFIASVYFNKALVSANINNDIAGAENNLISALRVSEEDQYYRTLADLNLIKINQLLTQTGTPTSQEVLQNQFRSFLGAAQSSAQAAVNLDKTDYQNWLTLGKVYESVVPLKVEGAYESAQSAYAEARKLNPKSPAIILVIARLDVAHSDIPKAKREITEALKLKPDYTDAIYFLSQIQANEGDIKSAISSTEAAAYLNPSNSGIYLQLGLLRYDNKDYSGAASAFEQSLVITPDYANAKYFLGLSYARLTRTADAIKQFQDLTISNPENAEVKLILSNLQTGRDPFANVQPPLDAEPQNRSQPPVQETNQPADTADR